MTISRDEFLASPYKAITLLGMSGVGKTHLSGLLESWGWTRYSCDYEIGHKTLVPQLKSMMGSAEDIGALSAFIGKPGNPELGGHDFETFKARQILYYEAECKAIEGAMQSIPKDRNFVHDSTGSLCEILNEVLLEKLGGATLFVYLKAGKEEEDLVLDRAMKTPKPLFYPPFQLESWIGNYMEQNNIKTPEDMAPDEFARWVFPKLFAARLPKYQRLADLYGVTVPCQAMYGVKSEADVLGVIAEALS
jgi:hypothetical protein